jgi:hypothetical protein
MSLYQSYMLLFTRLSVHVLAVDLCVIMSVIHILLCCCAIAITLVIFWLHHPYRLQQVYTHLLLSLYSDNPIVTADPSFFVYYPDTAPVKTADAHNCTRQCGNAQHNQ